MQDTILIFRTSITTRLDLKKIEMLFVQYPQIHTWSVDIEDWEKVLRIECSDLTPDTIMNALRTISVYAVEME